MNLKRKFFRIAFLLISFYGLSQDNINLSEIRYHKGESDSLVTVKLYNEGLQLRRNDLVKALALLKPHYDYTKEKKMDMDRLILLELIVGIKHLQGDNLTAIAYAKEMLELAIKLKDDYKEGNSYFMMGIIYSVNKDYESYLKYNKKAYEIISKFPDKEYALAGILVNLAINHMDLEQYDFVLKYLNEALEICQKYKKENTESIVRNNLCKVNRLLGNYSLALENGFKGLEIRKKQNDLQGIAISYTFIGDVYYDKKDYINAIKYLKESYIISKEEDFKSDLLYTTESLYKSYKAIGEQSKALKMLEENLELKDFIHDDEITKKLLKERFELEFKMQKSIDSVQTSKAKELLVAKTKSQQEIIKRRNFQFISLLVFLVVVSFLLYLINKRYKVTKQQKQIIQKTLNVTEFQKKEIEKQRDLVQEQFEELKKAKDVITEQKKIIASYKENYNDFDIKEFDEMVTKIKEGKWFKNHEISILDLSNKLSIPYKRISQLINLFSGKNFNTFINELRIEEAIELIEKSKFENYTIEGIAYESGFNSKSVFNTFFKKSKGVTPSEYIKSKL